MVKNIVQIINISIVEAPILQVNIHYILILCHTLLVNPESGRSSEDRAPLTQFAGGGQLPGAGGPLVLPVPAAGRAELAEQDEGE